MREIKFRAWDGNEILGDDIAKYKLSEIGDLEGGVYMQYTGLKDKNGKEIYFDDIMQHQEYLYQVVWNLDKIGFKQIKLIDNIDLSEYSDGGECLKQNYGKYFERKDLFNFYNCEIIGNIYQNPALLEKSDT